MARPAATDESDFVSGRANGGWVAVDDFVRLIEEQGRVCEGQRPKRRDDGMVGVVEKMFG